MLSKRAFWGIFVWATLAGSVAQAAPQQAGSIRGVVYDKDFDAPLPAARVEVVETGNEVVTSDQGNFVFAQVLPGKYTLVFSKEGFVRQVRADVVVSAGQLTEVSAYLAGEFTEMEEFIVQDVLAMNRGSEAALLELRFESPSFMDSVGSDLMSQAGAGDAASALRLVAGASLQDGKSAVIRGLPDRYVSTQLNGIRLPSADEDKRAVELDQFPSAVIESIQVSKTFTPDQQGDASGGAVNILLKGVPEQSSLNFKVESSVNSQVSAAGDDFLTYDGGGVHYWGNDEGSRAIQTDNIGSNWTGAVGTSTDDAPTDGKWSMSGGHRHTFKNDVTIGGYANIFHERDSSYFDDGINDSYWVVTPGAPLTPETSQGAPSGPGSDFKTKLFDVTRGSQSVQWGGLGTFGVETENHYVGLTYLYTQTTEDVATLATDTRGKEYFFPGYDPDDQTSEGNLPENRQAAPYLRTETLEYTERSTGALILNGRHRLPFKGSKQSGFFGRPEFDWLVATSSADLDQPDKRQFGAYWIPLYIEPGHPIYGGGMKVPSTWYPFKPDANFNLGNLQRIYKSIEEDSDQYAFNLTLPFNQWSREEGYLKFGVADDKLDREFAQETFSNFGDSDSSFEGGWDMPWSQDFTGPNGSVGGPGEFHPITESLADIDYTGNQEISAWYGMVDLPLTSNLKAIGGARSEATSISIVNSPEEEATWFPPGAGAPTVLEPGAADVDFSQDDLLPSIGLVYEPIDPLTLRASYAETVARQTFKELTPIIQQEFLGGPIFVGNPELGMSSLQNYDLRADYSPYNGSLLSASYFYKDIQDPIEYVQRVATFTFTTPRNYPKGMLSGVEFEVRQELGALWDSLENVAVGFNATFIDSEVNLPQDEIEAFEQPSIDTPMTTREMTDAPDYLYNAYITYDLPTPGTQLALFYTKQGDTLVAGAGQSEEGNFVPSVYALPFDTLNASVIQRIGEHFRLQIQGKNLTNPSFETVYRSDFTGGDVTRTSYTTGFEISVSLSATFSF